NAVPIKLDFTLSGSINAGDEIENSGFAGTVGTNQTDEFVLAYDQIKGGNRSQAAEANSATPHFENGSGSGHERVGLDAGLMGGRNLMRNSPCGRVSIRTMRRRE